MSIDIHCYVVHKQLGLLVLLVINKEKEINFLNEEDYS